MHEDLTEVMENSIQRKESLDELMQSVTLPPHWTISTTTEKNDTAVITVNIGKVVSIPSDFTLPTTSTQLLVVTHCITVRNDFSWTAFVHGHCVSDSVSPILSSIPKQLNRDSLISLIVKLDNCNGHTDNSFVDMPISRGGKITSRHGDDIVASLDTFAPVELNGEWYSQTVRSNSCRIITNSTKCDNCVLYRDSLRSFYHNWNSKKMYSVSIYCDK